MRQEDSGMGRHGGLERGRRRKERSVVSQEKASEGEV
jgi:hypothetical protein